MKERIDQKIGRIREYLTIIEPLKQDCLKKFETDPIYRGALLHYLYIMADTCVSLAVLVIRQRRLRPPQSYHEAFDILGDAGILTAEFAHEFSKIAGFRNFLAHDYERVKAETICMEVLGQLKEVYLYLDQIEDAFHG